MTLSEFRCRRELLVVTPSVEARVERPAKRSPRTGLFELAPSSRRWCVAESRGGQPHGWPRPQVADRTSFYLCRRGRDEPSENAPPLVSGIDRQSTGSVRKPTDDESTEKPTDRLAQIELDE